MNTWTEIMYDNHGYRLSYMRASGGNFMLMDEHDEPLLCAEGPALPKITLRRPLPLMLVVIVITRILDELAVAGKEAWNVMCET